MRKASQMSYEEVVVKESKLQTKVIQSEDATKAIKAFFAKETPLFKGK